MIVRSTARQRLYSFLHLFYVADVSFVLLASAGMAFLMPLGGDRVWNHRSITDNNGTSTQTCSPIVSVLQAPPSTSTADDNKLSSITNRSDQAGSSNNTGAVDVNLDGQVTNLDVKPDNHPPVVGADGSLTSDTSPSSNDSILNGGLSIAFEWGYETTLEYMRLRATNFMDSVDRAVDVTAWHPDQTRHPEADRGHSRAGATVKQHRHQHAVERDGKTVDVHRQQSDVRGTSMQHEQAGVHTPDAVVEDTNHDENTIEHDEVVDPSFWGNPLAVRLPVAPTTRTYCLYGIGLPTETAYFYRQGNVTDDLISESFSGSEKEPSKPESNTVKIRAPTATSMTDTSSKTHGRGGGSQRRRTGSRHVNANVSWCPTHSQHLSTLPSLSGLEVLYHDSNRSVHHGVRFTDGDVSVPVVSLGYMCLKGWNSTLRNPGRNPITLREYVKPGFIIANVSADAVDEVAVRVNKSGYTDASGPDHTIGETKPGAIAADAPIVSVPAVVDRGTVPLPVPVPSFSQELEDIKSVIAAMRVDFKTRTEQFLERMVIKFMRTVKTISKEGVLKGHFDMIRGAQSGMHTDVLLHEQLLEDLLVIVSGNGDALTDIVHSELPLLVEQIGDLDTYPPVERQSR
jgi:hypothetical protein